jgi:hypothetical protein
MGAALGSVTCASTSGSRATLLQAAMEPFDIAVAFRVMRWSFAASAAAALLAPSAALAPCSASFLPAIKQTGSYPMTPPRHRNVTARQPFLHDLPFLFRGTFYQQRLFAFRVPLSRSGIVINHICGNSHFKQAAIWFPSKPVRLRTVSWRNRTSNKDRERTKPV